MRAVVIKLRNMEISKTSHGKDMLCLGGFTYTAKKKANAWIRWACTVSRSRNCKGAVTTDETPINNPRNFTPHNHAADNTTVEVRKFRANLKESSRANDGAKTQNLLATAVLTLSPLAMMNPGNFDSIKRDIQRQKAMNRPLEPANIFMINVIHPWNTTGGVQPQNFLIHDSGPVADRVIVFAADEAIIHLANSTTWFIDGNFKVAPGMFTQVYVIRTNLDAGAVSCAYAFLPGKGGNLYVEMFTAIQRRMHLLNVVPIVTDITVDFEQAAYDAVRQVFGQQLNIHGCFFHLTQSTWRNLVDLGLRQLYDNDYDTKRFVGMMDGLAFLPVNDIPLGVGVLRRIIVQGQVDPSIIPLFEYFLDSYVLGRILPNQNPGNVPPLRSPPLFPPAMWNVWGITLAGGSRTNNFCEGWNRGFNDLVGQRHPPFFKAIECLQKDCAIVRSVLAKSRMGTPHVTRTRRSYDQYQRNLRELCRQYQIGVYQNGIDRYLRRISHNIRFDV